MRTIVGLAASLLVVLALGACREQGGAAERFAISGKLFIFNYRVATATVVVTLTPLLPMKEGEVVRATFENPAGGQGLVVEQKVWPQLGKVTVESPPLDCVVKDRPYAVTLAIVAADGSEAQRIETTVISSEDQSLLPDRPLVVGPIYTPNPELAGHPNGKLPGLAPPACPDQRG